MRSTKKERYNRISTVRMMRGVIISLLLCCGLLTYACFATEREAAALRTHLDAMQVTMMEMEASHAGD